MNKASNFGKERRKQSFTPNKAMDLQSIFLKFWEM